jgi:hypothetical protein
MVEVACFALFPVTLITGIIMHPKHWVFWFIRWDILELRVYWRLIKHSSWLNQIEVFFGIVHRRLLRKGNFTSVADLESQLKQFIEYYNNTMSHPFIWTYTGKSTEKTPRARFVPPHRRLKFQQTNERSNAIAS